MKKRTKLVVWIIIILVLVAAASFFIYYKLTAPPKEEWISYNNDKVIESIDKQLNGFDIENLVKNKETYIIEKNIPEIQQAVKDEKITYEEITAICLYRIKTLDQNKHGYNSVISVNPDAVEEARKRDSEYKRENSYEFSLYGIPVMLKDNINTSAMPTSAGAEAFSEFYPNEDAQLVKNLKDNGAIILGKNNLSEFANYVSSIAPAGYSGSKGQTVNPFNPLKISPSGSSSGSAVAVTANLIPVSIGTETDGSIIAPSACNSVVGFKPSRGSIPGEGIFPLIKKIDTAGPIARNVTDAAISYNAFSDNKVSLDYNDKSLQGKTVGLAVYEYEDKQVLENLRKELESIGAKVIDVTIDESDITIFNNISFSFAKDFEDYSNIYGLPIKNLDELLEYNQKDKKRRIKYGQDWLEEAANISESDMNKINESIDNANIILTDLFDKNALDCVAFLNSSGSSAFAAAGYPELTIPLGKNKKGVPQGATFAVKNGEDEKLLNIGYSFESSVKGRMIP